MPSSKQADHARIVSMAPSVTSILFAIGARRDVVGVSKWCKEVARIGRLPQVGDCWKLDVADVMKLRPTLLIGSVPFSADAVAKIIAEPVAFLALNPRGLADIEANIRTLGRLTNRAPAAEKLIARMRRNFDQIARRATRESHRRRAQHSERGHQPATGSGERPRDDGSAGADLSLPVYAERSERGRSSFAVPGHRLPAAPELHRPRVYCEAWPNPRISSPPWVAELVSIAGGEFVTTPGSRVSDEDVARANPDVIVLAWTATGNRADPNRALRNPAWQATSAVRNGRVVVIRDELLNTPGPPLMQGARALLRAIHALGGRNKSKNAGETPTLLRTP